METPVDLDSLHMWLVCIVSLIIVVLGEPLPMVSRLSFGCISIISTYRAATVSLGNSVIMTRPVGIAVTAIVEDKALRNCVTILLTLSVRSARKE